MPIHDWTRVDPGIFHHFHHRWTGDLALALNSGLLPPDHYALAEQIAGGLGPDVLTLQAPTNGAAPGSTEPMGGVALAIVPPKVQFRLRAEPDVYAAKARAIVIRHRINLHVVAILEIVSPGNKNSRNGLRDFVQKAKEILGAGVHLVIVDLFPPGPRDPQGIHHAIFDELIDDDFTLPPDKPLTFVSYIGGPIPEAFLEPTAVGMALPELPLFLSPDIYVPIPLEATYQASWMAVPAFYRDVLPGGVGDQP